MTAPLLDRRALNRATLARQLLLERSSMPAYDAIRHLVGLQAQTPQTWYLTLWSRLAGFRSRIGRPAAARQAGRAPAADALDHPPRDR
jgi:hypothetical protein